MYRLILVLHWVGLTNLSDDQIAQLRKMVS